MWLYVSERCLAHETNLQAPSKHISIPHQVVSIIIHYWLWSGTASHAQQRPQ